MVRGMRGEDTGRVAEIWLDTNIRAHSFIPARYWEDRFEEVRAQLPSAEVFVYEDSSGVIQGFVGLRGTHIEGIFVRSGAQSRGIGRLLLDAARAGKSRLTLNVYRKNARAAAFYRREGFRTAGMGTDGETGEAEERMVWERPALKAGKEELRC